MKPGNRRERLGLLSEYKAGLASTLCITLCSTALLSTRVLSSAILAKMACGMYLLLVG
nr:MAG TPA: hypothetical protein [Caudoviricetes sp.]